MQLPKGISDAFLSHPMLLTDMCTLDTPQTGFA